MAEMAEPVLFRGELEGRRRRLEEAARQRTAPGEVARLLAEVDAALARLEDGSFGRCAACGEAIEAERLLADPLVCFCLDHLSSEQRRDLERDLELAVHTQSALLPPRLLRHGGWEAHYIYRAAGAVSGDYCDLIPTPDGLFFCAGDVAGKGVAASLLMSHLHAMFRSLLTLSWPLAQVLEHANRIFCQATLPSRYATLVCGRAGEDGAVELAGAGHCPPVLLSANRVRLLELSGLPLGMFSGSSYPTVTHRFETGEGLVLYSDGVTEAQSPGQEEYGTFRLLETLAGAGDRTIEQLASAVATSVREFVGAGRLGDDLTLLVLRRV